MGGKDPGLLRRARRRHRHARLAERVIAGTALLQFAGTAFLLHRWNSWNIDASGLDPEWRPIWEMARNGQIPGILICVLGAVFSALMWGSARSRRRIDALLLKLADAPERDLNVPR